MLKIIFLSFILSLIGSGSLKKEVDLDCFFKSLDENQQSEYYQFIREEKSKTTIYEVVRNWKNARELVLELWEGEEDPYGYFTIEDGLIEGDIPHIDHILPSSWMTATLTCGLSEKPRKSCSDNHFYELFESDPRNLAPTTASLNIRKSDHPFCEHSLTMSVNDMKVFDDFIFVSNVNIETPNGVDTSCIIPPDKYKGLLARSQLIASEVYGIDLSSAYHSMLIEWDLMFPPDNTEIKRNEMIKTIINVDNHFITDHNQEKGIYDANCKIKKTSGK